MRKTASLPVRLEAADKQRLLQAAITLGTTPSALIRLLVTSFAAEWERTHGQITLPPHWSQPATDNGAVPETNPREPSTP